MSVVKAILFRVATLLSFYLAAAWPTKEVWNYLFNEERIFGVQLPALTFFSTLELFILWGVFAAIALVNASWSTK